MTNVSKTIIFFGTEDFSLTALHGLIDAGYNIAAVITKPDSKRGRGQILTAPGVKILAQKHHIPVWQPDKISDINDNIKHLGTNIAGVLVSFGKIIPQSTIDLFSPGIINVHPSLLPIYRGPSPIESAIKNGDSQTGVSIMQLSDQMDTGPVYGQAIHKLSGNETSPEIYDTLAGVGTKLLLDLLPSILDNSLQPSPQDESKAIYCNLLSKKDSWLNPESIPAPSAERLVRANLEFPKTKINISGHNIIITKSHVSSEQKSPLDILCLGGGYLSIDELIAPSGRNMSARDFINGYI